MPKNRPNPMARAKERDVTGEPKYSPEDVYDRAMKEMPVYRGSKNIKKPSAKEIQGMKNKAFMRKNPHTSA